MVGKDTSSSLRRMIKGKMIKEETFFCLPG